MLSSLTQAKGWVKQKFFTYGQNPAEVLPPSALNRLQEDDALLSKAVTGLSSLYHYPLIDTASNTIGATAQPDTFTLDDNVTLCVAGVFVSSHDLDTRSFTVPDNSTRYLRAEVADDCGETDSYQNASGVFNDPMSRKIKLNLYLCEGSETDAAGSGGGASTASNMRILKAVKGEAGSTPVITAYANTGYPPGFSLAEHMAANPAHAANAISHDNSTAKLPSTPQRVQTALDVLSTLIISKPYALLAYPHVSSSDNRVGATAASAAAGGKVTLPAGLSLSLAEDMGAGVGRLRYYTTTAWTSADLAANTTYYLRAQIAADGSLLTYVSIGTDSDGIPATLKGTPNAASGGGFDSTVLDALLAKIVTGAAGSIPSVTNLANSQRLCVQSYVWESVTRSTQSNCSYYYQRSSGLNLNWARVPTEYNVRTEVMVNTTWPAVPEGPLVEYSGTYTDNSGSQTAVFSRYKFSPVIFMDLDSQQSNFLMYFGTQFNLSA